MKNLIFKEFSEIATDKEVREAMEQLPENLNETIFIVYDELSRNGISIEKIDVFIFCLSFFQHHGGYTFYFPKLTDKKFKELIKKPFIDIFNKKSSVDFYDDIFELKQDKKPGYVRLIKSLIQWFCSENEITKNNKEIFIELIHALFIVTSGHNVSFGRGDAAYLYMRNLVIKNKYSGNPVDIRMISQKYGLSKSRIYDILFLSQRQKAKSFYSPSGMQS